MPRAALGIAFKVSALIAVMTLVLGALMALSQDAAPSSGLLGLLVGTAAAFVIAAYLWVRRWLAAPASRLERAAHAIGADESRARIPIETMPSESAGTAIAFNTMADAVEQRHAQLMTRVEQQRQQLLAASRDLERFAPVAAHDLKAPVRAALSFGKLLQERYSDKLDGDGRDFLKRIVDAGAHMNELITDLMAWANVSSKAPSFRPVDLGQEIAAVLDGLTAQMVESHATVTHDGLPSIQVQPDQIRPLFQHLVSNSLKFSSKEPPKVHVSSLVQGDKVVVSVADNGIGIAEDDQERIFEIFQRAHSAFEYGGTGVGLATCRRIVERHGGKIWVDSKLGAGATFRCSFPVAATTTSAPSGS